MKKPQTIMKWALFDDLLRIVNRSRRVMGLREFSDKELWHNFFDLSTDIDSSGKRRLQWTSRGGAVKFAISGTNMPWTKNYLVNADWCDLVIAFATKGAHWAKDVTRVRKNSVPRQRYIDILYEKTTRRFCYARSKGLRPVK